MRKLDLDFRERANSLGAIRLGLALLVVVAHCWQLGGFGDPVRFGNAYLSAWGLFGFFAVSGFLITRSRLIRPSAAEFYWARFLRIYPGFIVCLLVVAFVFAPLSRLIEEPGYYAVGSAVEFVLRNAALYPPFLHQAGIAETLVSVPFAGDWDEPLWSLFYEACCYVIVGVLVSVLRRERLRFVVPVLFAIVTVFAFLTVSGRLVLPYELSVAFTLLGPFLGGSVLCVFADRLPVARWDIVVSGAVLAVVIATGYTSIFVGLPLAHFLIRLSTLLPLSRVGRRWDMSYGIYIYGMPVQQIVILLFPHQTLPLAGFAAVVIVLLLPIAFASSALVEMPALRLKSWRPRIPVTKRPPALERAAR